MVRMGRFVVIAIVVAAWSLALGPVQAQKKDRAAEIKKLLKDRAATLDEVAKVLIEQFKVGLVDLPATSHVMREALLAKLQLQTTVEKRIVVLRELRDLAQKVVDNVEARWAAGLAVRFDVDVSRGPLLTAEIELLREELKLKADPAKTAEIDKLLKKRGEVFDAVIALVAAKYDAGVLDISTDLRAHQQALEAQWELHSKVEERVALLQKFEARAERLVKRVEERQKVGVAMQIDVDQAKAAWLQVRK